MEQILNIVYETGHMTIRMDNFFPTSQVRFKKLLKVVDLDWKHQEDHITLLNQHFKDRIVMLEQQKEQSKKTYSNYYQKVKDQERMVKDKKKPSGVMLTKDELEQAREDLKQYRQIMNDSLSEHKRCDRQMEQFKNHLKILKERV